ncbi:pyridoxal phosphate-dependent aminotransferase [Haloferax elongans ATCC BAA-1513]|uniref:Aminotransferase n=1 Tax=Haloferax elongans ATCC BAA-1513 TaxID=1230453 RepID=M0HPS1_HALEO|nr:pyridoxal phosphate-dependent aminotransferase [Haloferax elongans]ELZ85094.1 pyridoxal phosphate-dependent aminotransferase [Haloferax elongans ATCC BAA-1513]
MTTTFPSIPYLDWIIGRTDEVTHDLATSDLRPTSEFEGLVPPSLAGLPDPTDATLTGQLADRYGVSESNVLVTAGATHANFLAACALLDRVERRSHETDATDAADATDSPDSPDAPKPQVLVEKPGYQPLCETPEALGARVDRFLRPPEFDHALEPHRIESAAIDTFAYAMVTNRHNPSGRLATRAELAEMAHHAADAGGYLLVDEVYAPYVDPADDGPFGGVTAAGLPNVVVTGSLTKFYGLGGLRVGWLVGPEAVVARARQASMHLPSVADPSMKLARRALHNSEQLDAAAREHLSANHELLASFLAERPNLDGRIHAGGSFALFEHETHSGGEVVEAALDGDVLVVPGRFFDRSDAFRISLGGDPDAMAAALDAFGSVLDEL